MPRPVQEFLKLKRRPDPNPFIVVFGEEEFLKRRAMKAINDWVLGDERNDFGYVVFDGKQADLPQVLDEVRTPPFIGDGKLVVVEDGDPFVSKFRDRLLAYLEHPSTNGVLVLNLKVFDKRTKLYTKADAEQLVIEAATMKLGYVASWVVHWCEAEHQKTISRDAADWLVELSGNDLGILDQELAKLASAAGNSPTISTELVKSLVSGSRLEDAFRLLDLTFEGNIAFALEQLDRMLVAGEAPIGLLAMITSQLRKLGKVAQEVKFGTPLEQAVWSVGIPPFAIERSLDQMKKVGRARAERLLQTLLKADLAIKGGSVCSPRTIIEMLLIDLSRRPPATSKL